MKHTTTTLSAEQRAKIRQITIRLAVKHAELARWMARQTRAAAKLLAVLWLTFAWDRAAAGEVGELGPQPRTSAWMPTPVLAADVGQMALGGIGLFVTLIGYHLTIGKYIRQQAGVKDTASTTLEGQPIQVQGVVKYVAHSELEERLSGYASTTDLHGMERRLSVKLEEDFRELDKKRSCSIGNLHEHLTGTTKSLTDKIEHASSRQHDRIEAMSTSIRGEFDAKLAEVRSEITNLPGRVIALLQQTGQIGQGGKR